MAVSGTITQTIDNYGVLLDTITGFTGAGNTTPPFLSQGYPYGSAMIVLASGTPGASDTVQLQGSNDGVNFVNLLGTAVNLSTGLPAMVNLAVGGEEAPAKYYQFALAAGNTGTAVLTISCILMGVRG